MKQREWSSDGTRWGHAVNTCGSSTGENADRIGPRFSNTTSVLKAAIDPETHIVIACFCRENVGHSRDMTRSGVTKSLWQSLSDQASLRPRFPRVSCNIAQRGLLVGGESQGIPESHESMTLVYIRGPWPANRSTRLTSNRIRDHTKNA